MHRVDSDEHLANKFQDANPPTTAGTLFRKDWHNAVQEDLCRTLEVLGVTLAASGAVDEAAGWVSTRDGLLVKFIGADVRRYGADPTGAADSTAAFNAAFAASQVILVPEGIFKLSGVVTVPTSGAIFGRGRNSLIKIDSNGAMFDIENGACLIRGVWFSYASGSLGSNSRMIKIRQTVEPYPVVIDKCIFQIEGHADLTAIEIDDEVGRNPFTVSNCMFFAASGNGVAIRLGVDSSSKNPHTMISNCRFNNGAKLIEANYGSDVSSHEIRGCHLYDGTLKFNNAVAVHFSDCSIDIDSYDFDDCDSVIFENCFHPASLANTVPSDASAKASYFAWKNCRTHDGLSMMDGVRGTSADGTDLTNEAKMTIDANKVVAASTIGEVISTTNGYSITLTQHIGLNSGQSKLVMASIASGGFFKATGSGILVVQPHIRIAPGSVAVTDISVRIVPSSGQAIYLPYGYTDDGSNDMIFSGTYFFPLARGDTVTVGVSNRDGVNTISVQGGLTRDLIRTFQN